MNKSSLLIRNGIRVIFQAKNEVPFYVKIYEFVIIVHSRFTHCYLMTFPEDHNKFTILSKVLTNDTKVVLTYDTDLQANITHN